MPERGIREFLNRSQEIPQKRKAPEIDLWDVTRRAHYFGVNRASVIWRLRNLGLIDASARDRLLSEDEAYEITAATR